MRLPNLEDIQINIEQGIVTKKNVHTYWDPFVRKFPDHGWKIHISCYHDNYQEILSIISNFCFAENYSFKFVNDTNILKFTKFLKYKENHILNKIVPQTLEAIDRNYPKELGYYNGIAGIADTLLDAYIYTKNIKYFESVKIKVQIMMTFHTEKNMISVAEMKE